MSQKLQKFLSLAGVASRRKAETLIKKGLIKVNGKPAHLGQRIEEGDRVTYRGKDVKTIEKKVYYAFYKPRGMITTMVCSQGPTIAKVLRNIPLKVFAVGRLDKDSEGLLLITNDGEWANKIMHPSNDHEKEYVVTLDKPINDDIKKAFEKGLRLNKQTKLRPVKVAAISKDGKKVVLILKQGINRQIRRMFAKFGITVNELKRVRVGRYKLGNLKPGQFKDIKP